MTDQEQFEALADNFTATANVLHQQLMKAIRNGLPRDQAQTLFDNEVALRTRADSLYLDAAALAADGFGAATAQLLELSARASQIVAKIDRIKDLLDLSAELLTLGAAIAAGKPEHVLSPLEAVKHHIEVLSKG